MAEAIAAVPYAASVKVGLQFKRRFWEEDEQIYGGITYTDLPISKSPIPAAAFSARARACCWAPISGAVDAAEFTAMTPAERVAKAVEYGSRIHPQYPRGIRQRRRGRLASLALHAGLLRHVDRGKPRSALRQSVRHSMAASYWRANTPRTFPPGRKARSRRRSMPSTRLHRRAVAEERPA